MNDARDDAVERLKWFKEARFGLFVHFGPYSVFGRGEQVLFREHMDHQEYARVACAWNPSHFNPELWADTAKQAGMKYAVLTTRHHDGFCLWDTKYTDYSTAKQAPGRDFTGEYVEAFRKAGLKVGLYYSLLDWRIPSYFIGPEKDPSGWRRMREYVHGQVEELLGKYGKIDVIWFDGIWPRTAEDIGSAELIEKIRKLQPHILINNRLGSSESKEGHADGGAGAGESDEYGDFGTPEQYIVPEPNRHWEACMVSGWRLWGAVSGERWRPADLLLDMLCICAENGGNLILNVGPQADGQFPPEFTERMKKIGEWLDVHGEAVFGDTGPGLSESVTYGHQIRKGKCVYLIMHHWTGCPEMRVADLVSPLKSAELITTGQKLGFEQKGNEILLKGLPKESPSSLFPVIKLTFKTTPETNQWGRERLWCGDPSRVAQWALDQRGASCSFNK